LFKDNHVIVLTNVGAREQKRAGNFTLSGNDVASFFDRAVEMGDALRMRNRRLVLEDKIAQEMKGASAEVCPLPPVAGKPSSSSPSSSPRVLLIVVVLAAASIFFSYYIYSSFDDHIASSSTLLAHRQVVDDDAIQYVVVFDAGSTGTRIHVFQFRRRRRREGIKGHEDDDSSIDLIDERFEHVEPGLSAYADAPADCRAGLGRLIRVALDLIPGERVPSTPLILKATAGLRLLPADKAEALLREVRTFLGEFNFRFNASGVAGDVSILDGVDEGYFGWITVNYLLGKIGGGGGRVREEERNEKVATMDLGGGSTQITFDLDAIDDPVDGTDSFLPAAYVKTISVLGEKARIYTRSYLGLGIMAARLAILRLGTFGSGGGGGGDDDVVTTSTTTTITTKDLVSPCLPPWHDDVWAFGGVEYRVKGSPSSDGASTSTTTDACFADVTAVVSAAGMDRVPRRTVATRLVYAFSYYFDRLLEVGLIGVDGGRVSVKEIGAAARRVCVDFPRDKRPFLCADLAYIRALLTSGLGFADDDGITLKKKIAGKEASWSLGSAFSLIDSGGEGKNSS